ncbi:YeeE/YedE family protein [Candidatus Poribacteria bacterium]|nr:YeeE/YedE family protein [Candidatus Poribacteria bacterium]
MLKSLHSNKPIQLFLGLITGVIFGFLLHKGGVTNYDVIINQLLLKDFTVVKIMLSASITGMLGVHILRSLRLAQLHPKPGSIGATVIGGLIFGIGFAILGYCPGTIAGAVGRGSLDALIGGVLGITLGAGIFASIYPKLYMVILKKGDFGELTLPQLLKVNTWVVVIPIAILLMALLYWIEKSGL